MRQPILRGVYPERSEWAQDDTRRAPHYGFSCPGSSIPLPATPRGLSVTTFLKSGSERKLFPSRCSVPLSKVKCTLVEIVLLGLSYLSVSVCSRRPSGETTTTEPLASID